MKRNKLNKKRIIFIIFILAVISYNCTNDGCEYKVLEADHPPIIDGEIDEIWNKAKVDSIYKSIVGAENRKGDNDLSIHFRSLWDKSNIYFLFEVTDDVKLYQPELPWYQNDVINLFFGHSLKKVKRSRTHPGDILQYSFIYNVDSALINGEFQPKTKIEFKRKDNNKGYLLEIKIPWSVVSIIPKKKLCIPFNYEASDLDKKESEAGIIGSQETIVGWAPNTADRSWTQTKMYGDLILY